jgi:MFS family permease
MSWFIICLIGRSRPGFFWEARSSVVYASIIRKSMSIFTPMRALFQSKGPTSPALRRVFFHLYWDIAWFGILSGSTLSFLSIYATRLGADAFHIGLLSAGPAVVGLLFTLPAGRWLQGRPVGGAVFWSAALARIGYLLYALLPLLLPSTHQVLALVLVTLVMTIPNTVLSIGFNALYASAVTPEWRAHVAGIRNAMLALVFVISSLLSGWLLNHLPFTTGYIIIFGFGALGAVMSTVHLWFLRHITGETEPGPPKIRGILNDLARPGDIRILGITLRTSIAPRAFARSLNLLRFEVLRGAYGGGGTAALSHRPLSADSIDAALLGRSLGLYRWRHQSWHGGLSCGSSARVVAGGPADTALWQSSGDGRWRAVAQSLPLDDGGDDQPAGLSDRFGHGWTGLVAGGRGYRQLSTGKCARHRSPGLPGVV